MPATKRFTPSAYNEADEDDHAIGKVLSPDNTEDAVDEDWTGDYSSRMEEILSDNGSEDASHTWLEDGSHSEAQNEEDDDDDDEEFVYSGKDVEQPSGGYRDQLKDVLEEDELDSDDGNMGRAHEISVFIQRVNDSLDVRDRVQVMESPASEESDSMPSVAKPTVTSIQMRSRIGHSLAGHAQPYLHPSISRLRSTQLSNEQKRTKTPSSLGATPFNGREALTPSPSHISSMSRTSSSSNLQVSSTALREERGQEAFRWTVLRVIGGHIYRNTSGKANAVLGSPAFGSPTVLTANALICIGTDVGRVFVFDFKQDLKCVCGDDNSARSFGPVTALALSHDHTFIAVGFSQGHIQLFDIKNPHVAARTVIPTTLANVRSGRQEGHLLGSRIVSLGFISGRHTALVSADDQGLAFFHSLGKVLFMEASDCLRLLGKYPEEEVIVSSQPSKRAEPQGGAITPSANGAITPRVAQHFHRKGNAIISMALLPLGTVEHPTDLYQLVAMLTPIKLVIVGLKPTPKTWFRRHREDDDSSGGNSKWRGCLAWFPSFSPEKAVRPAKKRDKGRTEQQYVSCPLLGYSWGSRLCILRVTVSRLTQTIRNEKTGKIDDKVDSGKVNFQECGFHKFQRDILAIQWLNLNQIIVLTDTTLEVLDIRAFKIVERTQYDAQNLVSPTLSYTSNGAMSYQDSGRDIHHSVRVYKSKVFFLEHNCVKVGTLLSWADRILSYVQDGDFLSAINLARDYYLGHAQGNRNGLPENVEELHAMVGEKMSDLMVASARYAFSEDRLTDSTHVTVDNRGVDRTSLFEDLVSTCALACMALGDFSFLFEDLFQYYDDSGISRIYLHQLEPFILDNSILFIPPRLTQCLVAMHDEDGDYEAAERLIWHIAPDCLDINQALTLCQKYHLYDALIYIYNSALNDYITPVVELLNLVRKVQRLRTERTDGAAAFESLDSGNAVDGERLALNAYKIYPYLANILSGARYPSETPLPSEDALKSQNDLYSFLFFGRSIVWPSGENGRLVLTADEEGGIEPTYPYARLFLRFDAEAFLHVLDIAFEQSYFNDETNGTSRQIIVKILLDILATSGPTLSSADVTFVNIFLARNVPKYPQVIHIAPSVLQSFLVGLASDTDQSTREDRQLAAEFLLSAYSPHDGEKILELFEEAHFYRILRNWYRQEGQWGSLLLAYVHDPELHADEVFLSVEETLSYVYRENRQELPEDILLVLRDLVPLLVQGSIPRTALLIDKYAPALHSIVTNSLENEDVHKQYAYLRCLLGPPPQSEEYLGYSREGGPSTSVDGGLRKLYLRLLCQLEPSNVIVGLEYLPRDSLEFDEISVICEETGMYEAVVWLLNEDSAVASLSKLEEFNRALTAELGEEMLRLESPSLTSENLKLHLSKLEALCRMGIEICREDSQQTAEADIPLEDLWFKLLSSQIDTVQTISSNIPSSEESPSYSSVEESVLSTLRGLVQDAFVSLVAVSSTRAMSFPRLFKRLLDSTERSSRKTGTKYSEFRNILTSMLESYRSEGDLLIMSKRIVDADLFEAFDKLIMARSTGWTASSSKCLTCRREIYSSSTLNDRTSSAQNSIIASPVGLYHSACFPSAQHVRNI